MWNLLLTDIDESSNTVSVSGLSLVVVVLAVLVVVRLMLPTLLVSPPNVSFEGRLQSGPGDWVTNGEGVRGEQVEGEIAAVSSARVNHF